MEPPGAAPARLGRYELLARLATGGMGEIFLARLEGAAGFEKLFVVKRILPHLAGDARFRAMLIAEARIASMMTHANICHVYELEETDGQLYIVMEYLEGSTMLPLLRKLSKEGAALDFGFIGGVLQQAADGLHYAHELKDRSGEYLGIVHRDISPSNIFLTDAGVVKVLDFGIAKVKNASSQTQTGTVKGKYAYMAPEQLRGYAVDRRADVFALGVVMYEMLALRRLFQRKTDYLTFRAVMEQPIIDIRHYRTDCPDALATAVLRALDRDPERRFETARLFGTAVLDAIGMQRRPWSQGEISDFLSAHFADEIRQRSVQIANAVHAGTRKSMPQIAMPDDETELDDQAPDFSPVDSESSETPVDIRHLRGPSDEHTAVNDRRSQIAGGGDPDGSAGGAGGRAPRGIDRPASPPPLDTLRGVPGASTQQQLSASQQQPVLVINPRRSMVWPLVAFAMVAVSGGALFLVWQQVRDQRQNQPPAQYVFEGGRAGSAPGIYIVESGKPATPGNADPAGRNAETGSGEPVAKPTDTSRDADLRRRALKPPSQRVVNQDANDPSLERAIDEHLEKHQREANRCGETFGKAPPGSLATLNVDSDGRLTAIAITPTQVNNSPLGDCIKNIFRAAMFPRRARPYHFDIKLTTGPR
jgi:eukaryotic-like serine/threonine-protein kinase